MDNGQYYRFEQVIRNKSKLYQLQYVSDLIYFHQFWFLFHFTSVVFMVVFSVFIYIFICFCISGGLDFAGDTKEYSG